MRFDHCHYVPCIRWKLGEYQAMFQLSSAAKDFITPLIEVPEIGYDFEERKPAKSVDDHLKDFAKRIRVKWGKRPCFVDLNLIDPSKRLSDGRHPMRFISDGLRDQGCPATPVTGLKRDSDYQRAVRESASKDRRGVCLRIGIEAAAGSGLKGFIDAVLQAVGVGVTKCDLVLDLGAPNFEPVEGFAKLILAMIPRLPYLSQWRTFALIGTSFPSSMGEVKQSQVTIPRWEWLLYKRVVKRLLEDDIRPPTFGDYAVNHPDVLQLDMRRVKPSATIRYTADDSWFIVKGPNVRDNGFLQYRELCASVVDSPHYLGRTFSYGDEYIASCAEGTAKTGNLSTWRKVGTNHHLEKVVKDISSFFGSLGR
ncbi:MAG: beta family protein [Candidatus Sumerlaeota bacterium]|nr:beta family protein [Candidatus Sumerlaeota bacterium]